MHAAIVAAIEPLGVPFRWCWSTTAARTARSSSPPTSSAQKGPACASYNSERSTAKPAGRRRPASSGAQQGADRDGRQRPAERPRATSSSSWPRSMKATTSWLAGASTARTSWSRARFQSKIANWLIGEVDGMPIKDDGCSLKAFRASLIKEIRDYSEENAPLIPAMASIAGPRSRRSRSAPRPPVWAVEIRPVAGLQGAARPDRHQDRGVIHVAPAAMHRTAGPFLLIGGFAVGYALRPGPHGEPRWRCHRRHGRGAADRLRDDPRQRRRAGRLVCELSDVRGAIFTADRWIL